MSSKIKKSLALPIGLALYCVAMTAYFGPRLIEEGRGVKLWISIAAEVIVIIALFFALRHKEKLKRQWDDKEKQTRQ